MSKVSIVIPCYDEQEVLNETYKRLIEVSNKFEDYELIFINDGSTDNTLNVLKEFASENDKVKIISFSRNFGTQPGMRAGLDYATGDRIAFIDADLQDPPELLVDMVRLIDEEGYNVVYGKRTKRKGETFFKKISATMYHKLLRKLSKVDVPVDGGDFKVIDLKVANELRKLQEKNGYMRCLVAWLGYKQTGYPFERQERFAGRTKYSLSKMLKLSMDGIVSFSNSLLKIPTVLGVISLVLAIVSCVLMLVVKDNNVLNALVSTFPMLIGASILFSIGIYGEYVWRLFEEEKDRPIYIVDETINI